MHCAGFTSDTYDRYVLGLLEEPDRSQLEAQIQEQCPACLSGVQRSMNLWLVFAETLENAEPSEDFRGRIVRIAELSRKVLTFPKNSAVRERTVVPISTLVVICAITSVLLVATWYAARASSRMEMRPGTVELDSLAQAVAANQVRLEQETEKRMQVESQLDSSGRTALATTKQLQDSLLKAQAELELLKSTVSRDKQQVADTTGLLNTFSRSGARLLPMKPAEAAGKALAYAILANGSRLVFVGSNLPMPTADHTYQLWILRKESPMEVSAGVFTPEAATPSVVQYSDGALLTSVTGVLVTEEPIAGNYQKPSEKKLFEASTIEDQEF